MNIFRLNDDPRQAAQEHCDKHVVKMILEYGQLLSTAHRLLDGEHREVRWVDKRIKKNMLTLVAHKKNVWLLQGESVEVVPDVTYLEEINEGPLEQRLVVQVNRARAFAVGHANHPSNVWVRTTSTNYEWTFALWHELMMEYTRRYGKRHSAERIKKQLMALPKNIKRAGETTLPLAMPDEYKVDDVVTSYQNYYVGDKARFAKWTNREVPSWFATRIPNYDEANFVRTRAVAA